jgi:response regulator RpfG family c-di-GMP phosphodiesterase
MQKILILEDEPELLDLIRDVVEVSLPKAQVIACLNLKLALKALADNPEIALLICDQNLPDGKGHQTFEWCKKNNREIPYILCSSDRQQDIAALRDQTIFGSVQKPNILGPLEQLLEKFLKLQPAANITSEYARIRSESLLKNQPLATDVFIQLSEQKFVKILTKDSVFDTQDLSRYASKDVHYLFVKKEDQQALLQHIAANILSLINAKTVAPADLASALSSAFSAVNQSIASVGFTPEAQSVARNFSELAMRTVQANNKLNNYLEKIKLNPESYLSSHSITLSFIACALANSVSWKSDSIFQKLSLAAFLHDITIENQALAAVQTLDELKENRHYFSPEELANYPTHPSDAAALVNSMADIPPDVDNIILQHHERADGSGFPHNLTAQRISPLSALFIIAHDMTVAFIRANGNLTSEQFFAASRSRYTTGSFKTVMQDLDKGLAS